MRKNVKELTIDEVISEIRTYPASILMGVSTHLAQRSVNYRYFYNRQEDEIDEMFKMKYSATAEKELRDKLTAPFKVCPMGEFKEVKEFKINRAKELIKHVLFSKRVEPENPQITLETSQVYLSEIESLIARLTETKNMLEKENERWHNIKNFQRCFLELCRNCEAEIQTKFCEFLTSYDDVVYIVSDGACTYKSGHEGLGYSLCDNVNSIEELLGQN